MNITRILEQRDGSIYTCHLTQGVAEVAQLLADRRIGALPVMDGDTVVGIFSERDLVRLMSSYGPEALDRKLDEVMTKSPVTTTAGMAVIGALSQMTQKRIRHLPVIDSQERVIGIISIGDLVKFVTSEQDAMIRNLEKYIEGSL